MVHIGQVVAGDLETISIDEVGGSIDSKIGQLSLDGGIVGLGGVKRGRGDHVDFPCRKIGWGSEIASNECQGEVGSKSTRSPRNISANKKRTGNHSI